jgi:hypothetical protein
VHHSAQQPAHEPREPLDRQTDERRHEHQHEPEPDHLPADQRSGDQEIGILRDEIEERLRHRERRQRPEVKPGDWQRHDRWRA